MNALRNWRDYLPAEERLYPLLALAVMGLFGLGILSFVFFSLVPAIRVRGELISAVATSEQSLAAAQTAQAEIPGQLMAQIAAAQARVNEASISFLGQSQAAEALDRLYQYAGESGVTIAELTDQTGPQTVVDSVSHARTYGLRVTGSFPRLLNFLARVRESTLAGFVITNVEMTEGEDQHNATMNITLYTSPYTQDAAQPMPGVTLPPLQPLPVDTPEPAPTLLPTSTHELDLNCTNLIANGDFEFDGNWIFGQAVTPPQYTTSQAHSGARSMQLGYLPGAGANDRSSFSSIRQLVTIPANASQVSLRWWHLSGAQEDVTLNPGDTGDRQEVLLLGPDERVLAVLQRVRRADDSWQQEAVDLTAYRGQSVYIYFSVFNDGNGLSTWMYVDSVQLETCSGVTPSPTLTSPLPPSPTRTATLIPSPTRPIPTPPIPTPLPTATPGCANLIANGDFEFDGNWIFGQAVTPPQYTTSQAHSSVRSMQLGNPPGSGVPDRNSFSSIRQLVTIPANASQVSLRWWHLSGAQEAVTDDPGGAPSGPGDRQEVLLLGPDEQVFAILQRVRRADNSWQQGAVDLTAYRGQSVYIYFNVFNDGNGLSTWMYVDSVQVEACSGATPIPTPTGPLPPSPTRTATLIPSPTTPLSPTPTGTSTWTPSPTISPTPTLPAGCVDLIVNGGFESDGTWIFGSAVAPPQYTSGEMHTDARSIQLGSPPGIGETEPDSYSSIRQLVAIPEDADLASLRWWHLSGAQETVTDTPGDSGDRQEVMLLRPEGQVLTILQRVRRADSGWQQESVDLTAYRGQTIYVYFNVFNDGNGLRTWMYVDDVQLEVCSPGATPPPTPINTLPSTPTPTLPDPTFDDCQENPNLASAANYPVRIVTVVKDANPEVVQLSNESVSPIDLTGWRMCSITGNQEHLGISGSLAPGETRDFPYAGSGDIWNNSEQDDGALYNAAGQLVSYWPDN